MTEEHHLIQGADQDGWDGEWVILRPDGDEGFADRHEALRAWIETEKNYE